MSTVADAVKIEIRDEPAIVLARQAGREMARELGFGTVDQARIATAISELARNILHFAGGRGAISVAPLNDSKTGIEVVAEDQGPGIPDVEQALQDGYSTGKGLGAGLPGARRLMDEFEIESQVGVGTKIRCVKWLR